MIMPRASPQMQEGTHHPNVYMRILDGVMMWLRACSMHSPLHCDWMDNQSSYMYITCFESEGSKSQNRGLVLSKHAIQNLKETEGLDLLFHYCLFKLAVGEC